MTFCCYLYKDPKSGVWRYVGKGVEVRPYRHFHPHSDTQLARMLKKRLREGFKIEPVILPAESDADAIEMEILLISLIGREDLGLGTLFNKTDGGEGCAGRVVTQQEIDKRVKTFFNKTDDQKEALFNKLSAAQKIAQNQMDPEVSALRAKRISKKLSKPCTVDGNMIYSSRLALINACGQGTVSGSRSSNFRYV